MGDRTERAEQVLAVYKRSLAEGHPWIPGGLFLASPGLDQHLVESLEAWVEKNRVEEVADGCQGEGRVRGDADRVDPEARIVGQD